VNRQSRKNGSTKREEFVKRLRCFKERETPCKVWGYKKNMIGGGGLQKGDFGEDKGKKKQMQKGKGGAGLGTKL